MKRYPWLKLLKKSRQEPELEPPLWLGDHSNGEYYHRQTPRDRLIRKLILERADEGARKHGIERRQFLASSMGMATSLAVINFVAGCGGGSRAKKDGSTSSMANAGTGAGSGGRSSNSGSGGGNSATGHTGDGSGGSAPSGSGGSAPSGSGGKMGASGAGGGGGGGAGAQRDAGGVGGMFNTGDPMDPECTEANMLKDDVFVFDLQTHHIDRVGNDSYTQFFNLGYPEQSSCGKGLPGCFLQDEYIDLMFMQSHTTLAMLSAVPAVENELPIKNDEMAMSRDYINQLAHSQRVVIQGQVLPNNNLQQQLDGMQRLVEEQKIICWKVHTEWGPNNVWGNAPDGYWLDDMAVGIPFIEKARSTGVKNFCCHKGMQAPLFNADHCSPRDIGPVAKMYPDTNWVVYHSGYGFGGGLLGGGAEGAYQDGSMMGIDSTITVMKNSGIGPNQNVYAEIGGVWNLIMTDPTQAAHVIGKLLKFFGDDNVLWGSDAIWTAKPQPYVDAFWSFEITPEFQMTYGYPELTEERKRKILGLNSAKLFGIDADARRCEVAAGTMARVKRTREGEYGPLYWAGARPLGPTTRRDFFRLLKWREFLKVPG